MNEPREPTAEQADAWGMPWGAICAFLILLGGYYLTVRPGNESQMMFRATMVAAGTIGLIVLQIRKRRRR